MERRGCGGNPGLVFWLGCWLLGLGLAARAGQGAAGSLRELARADRLYQEKSYALALPLYEQLQQGPALPRERRDDVGLRIVVCLGKTKKWDRARDGTLEYLKAHANTLWEARALVWLAALYDVLPDSGRLVGSRLVRDADGRIQDFPEASGRVSVHSLNHRNRLAALEAAQVLYHRYQGMAGVEEEIVQLNYVLLAALAQTGEVSRWAHRKKWASPSDPLWRVNPAAEYSPDWPPPLKCRYLYDQIGQLWSRLRPGDRRAELALLAEAGWLHAYHRGMRPVARTDVPMRPGVSVPLPYPYQNDDPLALLREVVRRGPNDSLADQAAIQIAEWKLGSDPIRFVPPGRPDLAWLQFQGGTRGGDDVPGAVADLRRFLQTRSHSRWAATARELLQRITSPDLSLKSAHLGPLQRRMVVPISYRGVQELRFRLYPARLPEAFVPGQMGPREEAPFSPFRTPRGPEPWYGPQATTWRIETPEAADYRIHSTQVELPIRSPGAYVLEATGDRIQARAYLLVGALTVIAIPDRRRILYFAADSGSHRALPGVQVQVMETWKRDLGGREGAQTELTLRRVRTGPDGLAVLPRWRRPGFYREGVWAIAAWNGEYASSNALGGYQDTPDHPRPNPIPSGFSVSDRPVYRPGQVVFLRHLLVQSGRNGPRAARGRTVQVMVRDLLGRFEQSYEGRTSEFGTFHGSLRLPASAPLGTYVIYIFAPTGSTGAVDAPVGHDTFQVEEYKKPEFEVKVALDSGRVRPGVQTTARVQVRYYFGGPVPNAVVHYRIVRDAWSYFSGGVRGGAWQGAPGRGELVAEGSLRTNGAGEAPIQFTADPLSGQPESDCKYFVDVNVQDASRRVIAGAGELLVTRHNLFLSFPREVGYGRVGEPIRVGVVGRDAFHQPVSTTGIARIYRLPAAPMQPRQAVHTERLTLDQHGRAFLTWRPTEAARFRFEFLAEDGDGTPVRDTDDIWVAGRSFDPGRNYSGGIELRTRSLIHQAGQTATVFLVSSMPDVDVLVYRTGGAQGLEPRLVRLQGHSAEVQFPIRPQDAPTVTLHALAPLSQSWDSERLPLDVLDRERRISIGVQADRSQYEPGQRARLTVTARDWQGRPLRTELSLSVADAALDTLEANREVSHPIQDRLSGWENELDSIFRAHLTERIWRGPGHGIQTAPLALFSRLSEEFPHQGIWGYISGFESRSGGWWASAGIWMAAAELIQSFGGGMAGGGWFGFDPAVTPDSGLLEPGDVLVVRRRFEDTAFWAPALVTDAHGRATVEFRWPDNLTRWRARAVGTTTDGRVESGETLLETRKDLLVRLQAPRFSVERDRVALTAVVHNYTDRSRTTTVRLDLRGDTAEPEPDTPLQREAPVPANGELRVDWRLRMRRGGALTVRASARSDRLQDAMELTFPVLVHGAERRVTQSGALREKGTLELPFSLPAERQPGSAEVVLQLQPSLVGVALDALPYVLEYPYGCIEQTLSRFLPAVLTRKALGELGYDLEALRRRAEGLRRTRSPDPVRDYGAGPYTYPSGAPGLPGPPSPNTLGHRADSPVFSTKELGALVDDGLNRIVEQQQTDGGWGWWPADPSDPHMTTYVLYGLELARQAGCPVPEYALRSARRYLLAWLPEAEDLNLVAAVTRALAQGPPEQYRAVLARGGRRAFSQRARLSPYSQALLAMGLHQMGERESAAVLLRNLENFLTVDPVREVAFWEPARGATDGWYWHQDEVETNAAFLQAYALIQPGSARIPGLARWLANRRRAGHWDTTRATALSVAALTDYLRLSKELTPEYTLTVALGDRLRRAYRVTRENALFFEGRFVVPDAWLRTGSDSLTVQKEGSGALYYTLSTRYFSREEPIRGTGHELRLVRRYYRLTRDSAPESAAPRADPEAPNPFLARQYERLGEEGVGAPRPPRESIRFRREPLALGARVESGDLVDVELELESPDEQQYVALEDPKPAGCEPVELRSGQAGWWSHRELRDQKIAFFVGSLPRGRTVFAYRLWAELPGEFHVLPAQAYAMYVPDVHALSDEMTLGIRVPNWGK